MNIPAVTETLLKRHERIVGPAIETVAKDTCLKMAIVEKELSIKYPVNEGSAIEDQRILDPILEREINSFLNFSTGNGNNSSKDTFNFHPSASSSPFHNKSNSLSTQTLGLLSLSPTSSHVAEPEAASVVTERNEASGPVTTVPIAATFDAGWQRRGNGKSYNSQSGKQ